MLSDTLMFLPPDVVTEAQKGGEVDVVNVAPPELRTPQYAHLPVCMSNMNIRRG